MDSEVRKRLRWIQLYEETGNAGLVCLRCGISRPTLRKWLRRYQSKGIEGLASRSRRPKKLPNRKISEKLVTTILQLRLKRKLGHRRIQSELIRLHRAPLSLATIHKVLKKSGERYLEGRRFRRSGSKCYSRPIPGERIQMDTCKIAPGLYQYTAIDDCTRYRVLGLYRRRTASNSMLFLDKVIEEMPFPIQRIQTDRGVEFFAQEFQTRLMEYGIKFRPIRPRSPHLSGKVERSQKTDLDEFYSVIDLKDPQLEDELQAWQHFYNWHRPHGSLQGRTPMDKVVELSAQTPIWEQVCDLYDEAKEHIRTQHFCSDSGLQRLKRSM